MTYVNIQSVSGVGILFTILSLALLVGRFESRRRWRLSLGIDDWLIVPGAIFTAGCGIAMTVAAQKDLIGGHSPTGGSEEFLDSELERQVVFEKYEYGLLLAHTIAIGFIKLSILFFYRRVFRGHAARTPFDVANWTLIAIQTGWLIAGFFAALFACGTHIDAIWGSLADLKTYCFETFWFNSCLAIINFAMDLAVLTEPLVIIWTLSMKRAQKIQASCVFLIALFAVAAGCVRMVVWIKITIYPFGSGLPLLGLPDGNDDIGVVSILLFWNYVEMGVGMVVACLPSQRRYLEFVTEHASDLWRSTSLRSLFTRSSRSQHAEISDDQAGSSTELTHVNPNDLAAKNGHSFTALSM